MRVSVTIIVTSVLGSYLIMRSIAIQDKFGYFDESIFILILRSEKY